VCLEPVYPAGAKGIPATEGTTKWAADAAATRVEDGIDTFVFRDGMIRVQTVRYTLLHKG
jgi:hypothetical protein